MASPCGALGGAAGLSAAGTSGARSPFIGGASGAASARGLSTGSTRVVVSAESPSSALRYGLGSVPWSSACRRGLGRRPRRPGRRRSVMSSKRYWLMYAAYALLGEMALAPGCNAHDAYSRVHARSLGARRKSATVWNGNERASSHDVSGVAAWRGVLTRYRRRSTR